MSLDKPRVPPPYAPCGARTRNGEPCKGAAMANGRCRLHGGKTPCGPASPHFKHGRYSKLLRDLRLAERFQAILADGELGELRREMAIADMLVDDVSVRGLADDATPEEQKRLEDALETRRKLVDSFHKNAENVVPVERVLAFVAQVTNLVMEIFQDRRERMIFLERIRKLTGRRPPVAGIDPPGEPQ